MERLILRITGAAKNVTGDIYARYCTDNGTTVCDSYFTDNEVRYIPGIPGMASGVIKGKGSFTSKAKGSAEIIFFFNCCLCSM